MGNKTAMQELLGLVEQMFDSADALKLELPASLLNDIINIITLEGLQKEKEQIKESFNAGSYVGTYAVDVDADDYYNETYGN